MPTIGQARPTEDQLVAFGTLLGRSGKVIESEISGTSMESALSAGRRIRIRPLPFERYRPGQVVAFVSGQKIFAHRIVCCARQGALTRGDNRSWCDLPVPWGAILGLVTESQVSGTWRPISDHAFCEKRKEGARRAIETLLRVSLKVDIRVARFVARKLISFARWRHRLIRRNVSRRGNVE